MIALDLGTTNCKAVLLDAGGRVSAKASESYELLVPRPGWAEQDIRLIWAAVTKVLRAVAASEGAAAPDMLQGISISGAMQSLLPVADDAGTPIANAMTWADARAAAVDRHLAADADVHAIYRRTGCPVNSAYHIQRLRWWSRFASEQAQAAYMWVAIKDWILHALTGVWATDLSLASSTGLLNLHELDWDTEALQLAGVRANKLPRLVSPSARVGGLTHEAAALTGLPAGLPVIAGASDGAMACLGTGAAAPGETVMTVGTSGAVRRVMDRPWFDSAERTWCYLLSDATSTPLWIVGGAINNGGLTLQWVRDEFYPDFTGGAGYDRLAQDAASVPPGAEGAFLLPYFAGERSPHWAATARAMMYGLGLNHKRAHFARAAMEGVANCLADVWDALFGSNTTGGETVGQAVRLTGGITRTSLWVQIVADMTGAPLMALEVADTSAVGAGLLGLHALGLIGAAQMARTVEAGDVYTPDPERHRFYRQHHREYGALRRGMVSMQEALDSLRGA